MKATHFIIAICVCLALPACQQKESTSPSRKTFEEAVFASGYMEQTQTHTVSAAAEGILLSLPVKEGQVVVQGQSIALIQGQVQNNQVKDAQVAYNDAVKAAQPGSPTLQNLQAQITQAHEQLAFDKENYLRYKTLWATKSVAKVDYDKAQLQYVAAQNNLKALQEHYRDLENSLNLQVQRSLIALNTQQDMLNDYSIVANQNGTVINVYKKEGELVRRGEAIAKIAKGNFIIKLFVAEDDITKVNMRQVVRVNINTYPNEVFNATVTKIHPGFNEAEQSYVVEAQFEQYPEKMFSGTQLQANIATGRREDVLAVPTAFINKGQYVTLKGGKDRAVNIGLSTTEWTEITAGVTEADIIIK